MAKSIYETLEDGIVAALAPIAIGGLVEVGLFPDNDAQFKAVFSRPRVSVRYHSFTPGDPLAVSTSLISKSASIQIMFEAKRTRGELGIYDLEVKAEALLNGLKLPGYKELVIGQFTYAERNTDTGVWTYNLIVKTEGASNPVIDNITNRWAIPNMP